MSTLNLMESMIFLHRCGRIFETISNRYHTNGKKISPDNTNDRFFEESEALDSYENLRCQTGETKVLPKRDYSKTVQNSSSNPASKYSIFNLFSNIKQQNTSQPEIKLIDGLYPLFLKIFSIMTGKSAFYFHSNFTEQLLKDPLCLDQFLGHKNKTGHDFISRFKECFTEDFENFNSFSPDNVIAVIIAEFTDPEELDIKNLPENFQQIISESKFSFNSYPKIKTFFMKDRRKLFFAQELDL